LLDRYFSIEEADRKESGFVVIFVLSAIVFSLLSIYVSPFKHLFEALHIHSVNGCPLYTLTGIPCPFCGMGRTFSAIIGLHFLEALFYNPLGILFYAISGFIGSYVVILAFSGRKIVIAVPARKLWYLPVLFIIIMWVMNILYGHHQ